MISEQDKKEIFNGAYGVTENGKKAKFIFKSDHKANVNHPYLFIISDKDKCYSDWYDEHLNSKQDKFNSSIVDLWVDKPEPFNLEKALSGEPVMLRNGSKGFIKFLMPETYEGVYPYQGYYFTYNNTKTTPTSWSETGLINEEYPNSPEDIVGMWKEPQLEPKTVTLTLPCPVLQPEVGKTYYTPVITTIADYAFDRDFTAITECVVINKNAPIDWQSYCRLREGLIFNTKDDVKAWFNAMRNNRK